jgi:hypothetical protein
MVPGGCAEEHRGRRPARAPDGPPTDGGTMSAGPTGDRSGREGREVAGALVEHRAGFDPRPRAGDGMTRGSCPRKGEKGGVFPVWIAAKSDCIRYYCRVEVWRGSLPRGRLPGRGGWRRHRHLRGRALRTGSAAHFGGKRPSAMSDSRASTISRSLIARTWIVVRPTAVKPMSTAPCQAKCSRHRSRRGL